MEVVKAGIDFLSKPPFINRLQEPDWHLWGQELYFSISFVSVKLSMMSAHHRCSIKLPKKSRVNHFGRYWLCVIQICLLHFLAITSDYISQLALQCAVAMWLILADQMWAEGLATTSGPGLSKSPTGPSNTLSFPGRQLDASSSLSHHRVHIMKTGNGIFFKSTEEINTCSLSNKQSYVRASVCVSRVMESADEHIRDSESQLPRLAASLPLNKVMFLILWHLYPDTSQCIPTGSIMNGGVNIQQGSNKVY